MKKLYSLIKACMSNDMNLFKIKTKKDSKSRALILLLIAGYLMFMIWGSANSLFEKLAPMNIQYALLSSIAISISIMTFFEGVYKAGPLLFSSKDDKLLFSLPIKKQTILFVRIFKFYVFEVLFNSLFLLPVMVAYIRWAPTLDWTYYLTSIVMLLFLPIIPIVLSCFIGVVTTSISSRFKYKNATQVILSIIFILAVMYVSFSSEGIVNYLIKNATSLNDMITRIYYPAGMYARLVTEFSFKDLLIFIVAHIAIFVLTIFILSRFYFKINSRMKKVISNKKINVESMVIKRKNKIETLVKKELNTFFKTPTLIINAGFALVIFLIAVIAVALKFDKILPFLIDKENGMGIAKDTIMNNLSVIILILTIITSYMTSITNSAISLEGKSISILKSLPVKVKTILMSKIYSALVITTPVLIIGNIILAIKFKISIIESLLLIILSILIPLVSHFIGILINLRYPKLEFENSTEVVKQSASAFIAVTLGMILLILNYLAISKVIGIISPIIILLVVTIIYIIINLILYLVLINKGIKEFNALTV